LSPLCCHSLVSLRVLQISVRLLRAMPAHPVSPLSTRLMFHNMSHLNKLYPAMCKITSSGEAHLTSRAQERMGTEALAAMGVKKETAHASVYKCNCQFSICSFLTAYKTWASPSAMNYISYKPPFSTTTPKPKTCCEEKGNSTSTTTQIRAFLAIPAQCVHSASWLRIHPTR